MDITLQSGQERAELDAHRWPPPQTRVLLDHPAYIDDAQRLNVAQEGRGVFLDGSGDVLGAIAFNSVLSLPILLDKLVPQLAAAVDGDPATR